MSRNVIEMAISTINLSFSYDYYQKLIIELSIIGMINEENKLPTTCFKQAVYEY